jgi:frataxin-like iron-binding protein CyaY
MMGIQNLSTLFGPTLMKLSPKDKPEMDDMAREIRESMQQASALFYILKLHSNHKLLQLNFDSENNIIINNEAAIAHLQQIAENATLSKEVQQRRISQNKNHHLQTAL